MKNKIIKSVMIISAIAMILCVAACDGSGKAPEPGSPTGSTGSRSQAQSVDGIIYGVRYHYNGDPYDFGYTFYEDGTILDSDGDEGHFEFDGSIYRVYYGESLNGEFRLVDIYTIKEIDYATVYICDGGAGYQGGSGGTSGGAGHQGGSGPEVPWSSLGLSSGRKYYMHGNEDAGYLVFSDDWAVEIVIMHGSGYIFGGNSTGNFTAEGGMIQCTFDFFYEDMDLEVLDSYALRWRAENEVLIDQDFYFIREGRTGADYGIDEDGERIGGGTGVGERNDTLQYGSRYYLNGDDDDGYLIFWDDGEIDVYDAYGDYSEGIFSVYGYTIEIDLYGGIVELYIIDEYTLYSPLDGNEFIRVD